MEKRNNRVINGIMSNNTSSVIILSNSDSEHITFLAELSNRYPTSFWFNAEYDDQYSFSLELAEIVIGDEQTLYKMMQLKYCDNDKTDNIILNAVLENIKKRQGDCLFVFDHMEKLHDEFDFRLLEYLIKNCPKNLKLIFISEKLPDINYSKLERHAPKIVDEFVLGDESNPVLDIDVPDLSYEDLHFLDYVGQLRHVPMDFVAKLYQQGLGVLRYISIKHKELVINKGNCCFSISIRLREIVKSKLAKAGPSPFVKDIKEELFEYLYQNKQYTKALRLAIAIDKFDPIYKTLRTMFLDFGLIYRLIEFAYAKENRLNAKYDNTDSTAIYCYSAMCDYGEGKYSESLRKLDNMLQKPNLSDENIFKCSYLKLKLLIKSNQYQQGVDFINYLASNKKANCSCHHYCECILSFLPELMHDIDQKIEAENLKNCENYVTNVFEENSYLFIRTLQSMSEAYFDLGNYRKAIAAVNRIKKWMPFYVVPIKLLQYFYYINDPSYAERIALDALETSKGYDITDNLASIYCLLNRIYTFWGMKDEALAYIESAVELNDPNDFIKYYSVALRALSYARFSKEEFPKDIALIYAKQCEEKKSRYAYILFGAAAYWYWCNGQKEEALFYANKCLLSAGAKTELWLLATGVAINYAMENGGNEDLKNIVSKFFYTAEQYAMDMLILDFNNVFANVIKYAELHRINSEYISKLQTGIKSKAYKHSNYSKIKVQVMGGTSIMVNDTEVQWKTKKARELFIVYIMRGAAGIDRTKIFSLLWGEYIYESAINNLKTTNNIIRNMLIEQGIDFKLEYKNGKYTLNISNCEFDYDKYQSYVAMFEKESMLSEKITIMLDIVNMYAGGFAPDLSNTEVLEKSVSVKQDLCLMLAEFIKLLKEKGRMIDAGKFTNSLIRIDDDGKYIELTAKSGKADSDEN